MSFLKAQQGFKAQIKKAILNKDWTSYAANLYLRRRNIESHAIIRALRKAYGAIQKRNK